MKEINVPIIIGPDFPEEKARPFAEMLNQLFSDPSVRIESIMATLATSNAYIAHQLGVTRDQYELAMKKTLDRIYGPSLHRPYRAQHVVRRRGN